MIEIPVKPAVAGRKGPAPGKHFGRVRPFRIPVLPDRAGRAATGEEPA